jgi:hypothetical protein
MTNGTSPNLGIGHFMGNDFRDAAFCARCKVGGTEEMPPTAERYALLRKAEEYERKAKEEADPLTKRALEAVAREYHRRAEQIREDRR